MSKENRSYLLLMGCALVWGFAFVAQRLGAEHLGAYAFNAARGVLGAVALAPLVWFADRRAHVTSSEGWKRWREAFVPGAFIGLMFFGGQTLQQLGIEQTTAGNAAFVTGLYMVLVPIIGMLFGQRAGRFTWVGLVLAVPGLFLLTWTGSGIGVGDLLCLIGAGFWALHILGVGRFAKRVDPLRLSAVQFIVLAALSAVVALVVEPNPFAGLPLALGAVLYTGVVSTGLGFTLQILGQRHARASIAAMIMSLEAMWGAIGGALFLGERLTTAGLVGAAMMMAGILVAQLPTRDPALDPPAPIVPEPPSTALRDD